MMIHKDQFIFLKNCFENNFPQSWIFFGPNGVGKYEFTLDFIKRINNLENLNQYVFEINNLEKPALIDDIRELISKTKLTNSFSNKLKTFFLIHQMETLNINCINALLKTIEEPPENTVIIILTHNLRNIPKTIQSRCIKLKFNALDCKLFSDEKEIKEDNFLISNYNPKIFDILSNEEGESLKKKILLILKKNNFELNDFYELFEKISVNFNNYFSVIINIIFFEIKSKISSQVFKSDKIKSALIYLEFIKNISINELNIDKKKVLRLIFSEYFRLIK